MTRSTVQLAFLGALAGCSQGTSSALPFPRLRNLTPGTTGQPPNGSCSMVANQGADEAQRKRWVFLGTSMEMS